MLLLMVTLSMLAGALVTVHRGHWALALGQDQRIVAHQCCLSAVDYARDRLQAEPAWGTGAFGGSSLRLEIPGQLRAREQGSDPASNRLELELPAEDGRATLQVVNNLAGSDAVDPPFPTWRNLRVPAHSALLVVVGRNGSQSRRVEVLLHRRPPLDGGLYSGQDLAMIPNSSGPEAVSCEFDGEDATKNKLRARGKVYLPGEARFLRRGAATGRGDVRIGATLAVDANGNFADPSDGLSLANNPGQQAAMETQLGASLNVGPVPQLRLDASDLIRSSGTVHPLPAGKYTFVAPGKVEFQSASGGPSTTYEDAIYDGGASSGTPGQMVASLSGRKFMLQGQVESNGALEFDSAGGLSQAELALGYSPLSGGIDEPGKQSSLRLHGDLKVRGHVVGQGSVAALQSGGSGGNITVSGRSTLSSAANSGLALYSEGNLQMRPSENTGDVTLAADFEALRLGMTDPTTSNPNLLPVMDTFETLNDSGREGLLGVDDWREPGPGTAKVRDAQISTSDYQSRVQPLIPNWPLKTPGGVNDVPPAALSYVENCLTANGEEFQGGMTIGRHSRLMAFLRSVDDGHPEPGWLIQVAGTSGLGSPYEKYNGLNKGNLTNLLFRAGQDARLQGHSPSQWLNQAGNFYQQKDRRDIDWRGLVYAKGKLWGQGNKHIDVVGALGSEMGSLIFDGFTRSKIKFHYSELNPVFQESSLRLEGYAWYVD
ncbi:hypothetical protein ABS71_13885 [bacterium SCN 62-11]|nr:MAG: hypothetical protein ABS71_13885 [bacterium SCN 62-11]